jgi:hypothetical protein
MEHWAVIIGAILTLLGTGGIAVSWLLFRKATTRIKNAEADKAETQANVTEFEYLRKRIEFDDQQLLDKDKIIADKTQKIRELNAEIVKKFDIILEKDDQIAELRIELVQKRCEVRKCPNREPPNGF